MNLDLYKGSRVHVDAGHSPNVYGLRCNQKWPLALPQALNNQFNFTLQHFCFFLLMSCRASLEIMVHHFCVFTHDRSRIEECLQCFSEAGQVCLTLLAFIWLKFDLLTSWFSTKTFCLLLPLTGRPLTRRQNATSGATLEKKSTMHHCHATRRRWGEWRELKNGALLNTVSKTSSGCSGSCSCTPDDDNGVTVSIFMNRIVSCSYLHQCGVCKRTVSTHKYYFCDM